MTRAMRLSDFDFDLPPERIALRPARPRDSARLLKVESSAISDHQMLELPDMLRPGDVLVFNDTKVIPAQLEGKRGEASIGATLHKREGAREWQAFLRNAKRARVGDTIDFGEGVAASVVEKADDGSALLHFHGTDAVELLLERAGRMPLPPYIASRRSVDEADREDYQTMFAREEGAVAAPTAALHFTPRLLDALDARGVGRETLTLHVGAGTFLPVKSERIDEHKMHAEWGRIDAETARRLNGVRSSGGRLISVGTTSLRLLESAADEQGVIQPFEGDTAIFITPGYRFRAVDGLITNFHLPRSTLFMLVSALMGLDVMKAAYAHAIDAGYRFYSYGDASLLLPG
jgi:S-adenosylmethionine:tRNA ribosyltransferase-isomerase